MLAECCEEPRTELFRKTEFFRKTDFSGKPTSSGPHQGRDAKSELAFQGLSHDDSKSFTIALLNIAKEI